MTRFSGGSIPVLRMIEAHPVRTFAIFAIVHAALWTLLPSLLFRNLPLDIIEALTYGHEWQLGYDKLPPLPWWLIEALYQTVGHDFAYYLLAQIFVVAAFALVWAAAQPLVGAAGALASVLIVDGLHYFTFTAPKFNHDVAQLPFWALAGFAFHAAIRRGRVADWILLGLGLGMGFWAKYFVIVLAIPMALFVLFDREARPHLRTAGPYVAVAVGLLVVLPHLVWLVANNFVPISYVESRAVPAQIPLDYFFYPTGFAGGQLWWLLPSLIIAAPLFLPRPAAKTKPAKNLDYRIVSLLTFGPIALIVASSLASGRGLIAMWGYPLWLFAGLWLVMTARASLDRPRILNVGGLWLVATVSYAVAFFLQYEVFPYHYDHYIAVLFPGQQLADFVSERFLARTGQPLRYVIGGIWLGGNVHHYAATQPRLLVDGKPQRAPWIDLNDLRAHGAVAVWYRLSRSGEMLPEEIARVTAGAKVERQPLLTMPMRLGQGSVQLYWAIILPK